jgi:hypothetical protein
MGRLTAVEREQKIADCKKLFISEFSLETIHQITGITVKTIASWRDKYNWTEEKELNTIKPSEIRKLTLKQALAISKGEPLPYKTDDISKIVAAFDRITDNRKIAVYTMESIDGFSNFMLEKAATSNGKQRALLLEQLKQIRPLFNQYVTRLLQDD